MSLAPVAPLPAAAVGQKIARLTVQMQRKVAHLLLMGWQWRYWGEGHFTPMQARWDVKGSGEWRDNAITLSSLSTGFDKLEYGTMRVCIGVKCPSPQ